jgi:hypothetical protein
MEILINNHLARENNLTTWHMWAMKATRVATFRDDYQRVRTGCYLTLVPSSTRKAHQVVRGVARTLSLLSSMKRGKVSSNSATTKLLSFQGHYCLYASVHNSKLVAGGTTDVVLNWHRRGYHLRSSEYHAAHSHSFPSSILHFFLVAPPSLIEDNKNPSLT